MGRGLSELQKQILAVVVEDGCIESRKARSIAFDLLPDRKKRMRQTSSAMRKWSRRNPKRVFTASERRDACVAVSASRALARLCRRGLLVWFCMGHVRVQGADVYSYVPPFYALTEQGRLTVKAVPRRDGVNR